MQRRKSNCFIIPMPMCLRISRILVTWRKELQVVTRDATNKELIKKLKNQSHSFDISKNMSYWRLEWLWLIWLVLIIFTSGHCTTGALAPWQSRDPSGRKGHWFQQDEQPGMQPVVGPVQGVHHGCSQLIPEFLTVAG